MIKASSADSNALHQLTEEKRVNGYAARIRVVRYFLIHCF